MEFTNLQYQGINMGRCGAADLEFLRTAGVRWGWLETVILHGDGLRKDQQQDEDE